ncbi:BnaA07g08910D [Brassica napus]|uniref:BnaA07g08910D protein n=1 Tax=Brassica napus TaxID=3708 RepID=A0A078FMP3_BRANA|nr:BnaA07g08910D [Brassica napus]
MVPIRNPFLNSPYIYFIFTGGVLLLKKNSSLPLLYKFS